MSIPPGGEIGSEVHKDVDQVLVFVQGEGQAILDGEKSAVSVDRLVHVPAGTLHNFVNTGKTDLRLYTIYAPPEHAPGTIHKTKAEATRRTRPNTEPSSVEFLSTRPPGYTERTIQPA